MNLIRLDTVDSTNEEAFRQFTSGHSAPFFVIADRQEQGRGRSNRQWQSPKGNLYLSCVLENPAPAESLPQLGFVAGVALIDALLTCAGMLPLRLKWPNDVLVQNAKLAGILLEARASGNKTPTVIGWGVNVASCPQDLPYPAIALHELAPAADLDLLRQYLMNAFMERLQLWQKGENFSAIRTLWTHFALPVDSPVSVNITPYETASGMFGGIDADGSLLLKVAGGVRHITAGDVILPHSPPGALR